MLVQNLRGQRTTCAAGFEETKTNTMVWRPPQADEAQNNDELAEWAWSLDVMRAISELGMRGAYVWTQELGTMGWKGTTEKSACKRVGDRRLTGTDDIQSTRGRL